MTDHKTNENPPPIAFKFQQQFTKYRTKKLII